MFVNAFSAAGPVQSEYQQVPSLYLQPTNSEQLSAAISSNLFFDLVLLFIHSLTLNVVCKDPELLCTQFLAAVNQNDVEFAVYTVHSVTLQYDSRVIKADLL